MENMKTEDTLLMPLLVAGLLPTSPGSIGCTGSFKTINHSSLKSFSGPNVRGSALCNVMLFFILRSSCIELFSLLSVTASPPMGRPLFSIWIYGFNGFDGGEETERDSWNSQTLHSFACITPYSPCWIILEF